MRDVFRSALDAFSTNRRRFLLTVAMLAVGVASLVGIETAVDVLAREVVGSFDKLGAATLLLRPKPDASPISARQAFEFRQACFDPSRHAGLDPASQVSVWSPLQDAAIVRSGSKATDPVVHLMAVDEDYIAVEGLKLAAGRRHIGKSSCLCLIEPAAAVCSGMLFSTGFISGCIYVSSSLEKSSCFPCSFSTGFCSGLFSLGAPEG